MLCYLEKAKSVLLTNEKIASAKFVGTNERDCVCNMKLETSIRSTSMQQKLLIVLVIKMCTIYLFVYLFTYLFRQEQTILNYKSMDS